MTVDLDIPLKTVSHLRMGAKGENWQGLGTNGGGLGINGRGLGINVLTNFISW